MDDKFCDVLQFNWLTLTQFRFDRDDRSRQGKARQGKAKQGNEEEEKHKANIKKRELKITKLRSRSYQMKKEFVIIL